MRVNAHVGLAVLVILSGCTAPIHGLAGEDSPRDSNATVDTDTGPCRGISDGTPAESTGDWESDVAVSVQSGFRDGACATDGIVAVAHGSCAHEVAPTAIPAAWIGIRRRVGWLRDDQDGELEYTFNADLYSPAESIECVVGTGVPRSGLAYNWIAHAGRTAPSDWEWPGILSSNNRVVPPGQDVASELGQYDYSWVCLDALPAIEGYVAGPAAWHGTVFGHLDDPDGPGRDYIQEFDSVDCVYAETPQYYEEGYGWHATSDSDRLDNDYDGIVDEGPDCPDGCTRFP